MPKRVLVIDDDDAIQKVIKSMLLAENYDVVIADDGKEGLLIIKESRPDVIILDIMMPVMDGMEFLKQNKDRSIPIIILTSLNNDGSEKKVKKYGIKYFLRKDETHIDDIKEKIAEVVKADGK